MTGDALLTVNVPLPAAEGVNWNVTGFDPVGLNDVGEMAPADVTAGVSTSPAGHAFVVGVTVYVMADPTMTVLADAPVV